MDNEALWEEPMKRPSRPRTTAQFSDSTHHQLNMYAVAAGAAGVGMLASAQPAEARIVYTPANIPIVQNNGFVELDLNHDGINDFQFYNFYCSGTCPNYVERGKRPPEGFAEFALTVGPVQASNRVRSVESNRVPCAAHLLKGKTVGPHSPFQPGHSSLFMDQGAGSFTSFHSFGPWLKAKQGFLGLKFVIKGKIHFGWAHIQIAGKSSPTITGYAYETVPHKAIVTGQTKETDESVGDEPISLSAPPTHTPTLGMLAMGVNGLSIWRRESVGSLPQGC
jgi:hypothetical protein